MLLSILCLILSFTSLVDIGFTQDQDDGQGICHNCCQGPPGVAGPKGDRREPGVPAHTQKSAFSAIKTSYQTGDVGDIVTFQETSTNINNHFNLATSIFTCFVPGTYIFSFSIGKYKNGEFFVRLMQNGNPMASAHLRSDFTSNYDMSSNTVILNLVIGDQVWLEFYHADGCEIYGGGYHRCTSFSGYLLYEN